MPADQEDRLKFGTRASSSANIAVPRYSLLKPERTIRRKQRASLRDSLCGIHNITFMYHQLQNYSVLKF
jgi:hypothetical protein